VVHLLALARRINVPLELDEFDRLGHDLPCIVNLQPSGKYLMEDFYYAGGLPVVIKEFKDIIHNDALTVNGSTIGENNKTAENYNPEVIRTVSEPFKARAGIAVLRGNLCPRGAVIKPSAASPHLMKHRGKAVAFENIEDLHKRVDDDRLEIDENNIMVLKNCGPKGYPGMAEVGNMPLPRKILKKGITDMVRISDGRMSGTAYGTCVLHVSPEAAIGGNLALVKTGDWINLDIDKRSLHLEVSDAELAIRRKDWKAPHLDVTRGYQKLYIDHVTQADEGVDLDFLAGKSGAGIPRENH